MSGDVVIGVVSGCGGAGASTVAAVLAGCAAIGGGPSGRGSTRSAEPAWRGAVLIDLDPLGGGIDVLLGCEQVAGPRWSQVLLNDGDLPASLLRRSLPLWNQVSFLAADDSRQIEPTVVDQVITSAIGVGPVVLDLPRWPSPARTAALDRCSLVVLVTAAQARSVTASAVIAAGLPIAGTVVAVRGSSRALSAERISAVLQLPLLGELPYDPAGLNPAGLDLAQVRRGTRRLVHDALVMAAAPVAAA